MIISKIIKGEYIYFNLHAEQTITSTYLDVPGRGIYENILTPLTLQRVQQNTDKTKHIILDFKLIETCQNNIQTLLNSIRDESKSVILVNINTHLIENLGISTIRNSNNILIDGFYNTFYLHEDIRLKLDEKINLDELFEVDFKERLKLYITKSHNKPHTSSSVYLSSYVDLKKFISLDRAFIIYSIYILALKISNKWLNDSENKPILICQNLNSSFIVSILSSLLKLDILILDKIGPINKLYSRLGNTIESSKNYIIVSDLVCLGTEVKIVKNLIEFLGGKYLGNVSLIRTETLKLEDKEFENALCVFTINSINNKELDYYIYTNLES